MLDARTLAAAQRLPLRRSCGVSSNCFVLHNHCRSATRPRPEPACASTRVAIPGGRHACSAGAILALGRRIAFIGVLAAASRRRARRHARSTNNHDQRFVVVLAAPTPACLAHRLLHRSSLCAACSSPRARRGDQKWVGMASALPLPGFFALAVLIDDMERSIHRDVGADADARYAVPRAAAGRSRSTGRSRTRCRPSLPPDGDRGALSPALRDVDRGRGRGGAAGSAPSPPGSTAAILDRALARYNPACQRTQHQRTKPPRARDLALSAAAPAQSGRLVAVGTGGAGRGAAQQQADPALGRLRRLPLVPRDGARELRGRRDRAR